MANLITLDEYKTSERIESTKDDNRLNSLIVSVSQLVKTYCNNTIVDHYTSDKTEVFSVNTSETSVQLSESPVNSIVSVKERASIGSAYTTLVADTGYYLDTLTDSIFRSNGGNSYKNFPRGPGSVEVVYKAGWATCPADLQLAVIDLIRYYFKDEHKQRQNLGGASIQNPASSVAYPDHIKRVLDLYKSY